MKFETIIVDKKEGIATIILNRPEKGNAVSSQMRTELPIAIDEVGMDRETRVLILTGAGRVFCGGGDTAEIGEGGMYSQMTEKENRYYMSYVSQKPIHCLRMLEIPVIAMVNGYAAAGGFDLACACDIRIGSVKARFSNAFVNVGLATEWGVHYYLPRIVGLGRASEILYTGRWVDAEEAERIGLLNRVVPAEDLEKETMDLARQLAGGAPIAIARTKLMEKKGLETDCDASLQLAAEYQGRVMMSADHQEGIAAWREKREPVYRGI